MDVLTSACSKDNKIITCLESTCSGEAVKAGVSNSALPTLDGSVYPALHSNNKDNFNVTSALSMGSKLAALLHDTVL